MATATLTAPPSTRTRGRCRLAEDLLAVAWEPGAAPPREIRVLPELRDRLAAQLGPAVDGGLLGDPAGVPLVVDASLPRSPGFEVRRVPPR
jgi:hypothetical protein